jgi:hypothetical protein
MWVPTEDEAIEMYARHFEALHRSGSATLARQTATELNAKGDRNGHRIWNDVAHTIDRLRHKERITRRRKFEMT